jgi:hypothetical protein
MKKYSYCLFPPPLLALGALIILLGMYSLYLGIESGPESEPYRRIGFSLGFVLVGLVFLSFRSTIILGKNSDVVIKESRMLGMRLSQEKVRIPKNCKGILLKQKQKQGMGYYKAVIPMSYNVSSCDMFFYSDNGVVRIINTDLKRAVRIAEFIKTNLGIEYLVKE